MATILVIPILMLMPVISNSVDDPPPPSPVSHPELRLELLRRVKHDQDARKALIEAMKGKGAVHDDKNSPREEERKDNLAKLRAVVQKADKENTERLIQVVEKHGWPTQPMVGKDGANAAWLLVQHADANIKFQRKCLDLMTKLPRDQVSPIDVAYLTDRVLLAEGKKQIYGTQFHEVKGEWEPKPLEDPANVDQRRAEVGLPPLAEYIKQLKAIYGGETKK